jgi:para-aminobenzoate synthetase component 1
MSFRFAVNCQLDRCRNHPMTAPLSLPYHTDNSELFSRLSQLPQALWLDSQGSGRHDLIMAMPRVFCHWSGNRANWSGTHPEGLAGLDAFAAARALQTAWKDRAATLPDSPFQGGIAGFWGYDCATADAPPLTSSFPDAAWGWYDWFIVVDHQRRQTRLVFLDSCLPATREAVMTCLASPLPRSEPFRLQAPFAAETPLERYASDVRRILDYIHAGDCYQVNYTQAFTAPCSGSGWAAYRELRRHSKSPYAAFLSYPFGDIICLSPEQFLEIRAGHVHSKPIKGTRPRFPGDPALDAAAAQALLASAKDRAENIMITDLLRNDIGQHAETGSVAVEALCALESFSLVHHLVSTITARLKNGSHPFDLFRDAFPGGSITGAPKHRAMEIIRELEATPRSVYCGSIGYLAADGSLETNIAIRTLVCANGHITAWAGGGITADSVWEDEYQECFNKIGGIIRTLEAMR